MRHTRNRQMRKLRKWDWKVNYRIGRYDNPFIDPAFKWHRECYPWGHNYVEIDDGESLILLSVRPKWR